MSDGFLDGVSLIVDILGVPDGEDGVGRGAVCQPGPGHLKRRNDENQVLKRFRSEYDLLR